jgi:CRISPR-associated endonuclease/helicase Cas3
MDAVGWATRMPLTAVTKTFSDVFRFSPRPLQQAVENAVQNINAPCILLIEAPMGEGKTEAAFYAHLELQRRFGHRGLYIALPSKATGNAMFERTLAFLRKFVPGRELDLQLLHGAVLLNDSFQKLRPTSIYNQDGDGGVRAHEWFTHKKRALLSEYGVGTIDQALIPVLPVRHNFVRLWGLANRVIVFDEIHAYDAYTGTLLLHLIQWLKGLGSSVILLSATLPPSFRRALAKIEHTKLPELETSYPRLSILKEGSFEQIPFDADPSRRRIIRLDAITPEVQNIRDTVLKRLDHGGFGLILVNTVQRAQELYNVFLTGIPIIHQGVLVGKCTDSGIEVYLFHARFPADQRQKREDVVQSIFGPTGTREGIKILIATQVAEQSLDLDFDLMVTDLAPIDLILQRVGRLWRHDRGVRPVSDPVLVVAGIDKEEPPSLDKPLWWGQVYREDLLLRTWILLRSRNKIIVPDEIDTLVKMVYEDEIETPDFLLERMEKASVNEDGEAFAAKGQANQAHIGFPDNSSWNDSARFVKSDEDEPGLHRSLMAKTRLGEDSVVAIPIFSSDQYDAYKDPGKQAKPWFLRAVSLSRKGVVKKLQSMGVPEGWKKSPLLRNCYPMQFSPDGFWLVDEKVHLDESLGLVYMPKEAS